MWPRTVIPTRISDLWSPGALKDFGISGIIQIRATLAVGWSWEEVYPLLSVRDVDHMELTAYIKYAWNRGIIFTLTHPLVPGSGIAPNGLGTAGVLVDGASQTGDSILVDGYPIDTPNCVRAGDAFSFAADNAVYIARASAGSNGAGEVTIPLNPNLRLSPANDAAVTNTGVTFRATLLGRSRFEKSSAPSYFADYTVLMTEAL